MTYEMYRYVFLGGALASGIMLAVTVILFFKLQIPKVISDLTGRSAKRAIEDIRRQTEEGGDQSGKPGAPAARSKMTDRITGSGRVVPRDENEFGTGIVTQKIATQQLPIQGASSETTVLAANETTILGGGVSETTVLAANETTILGGGTSETMVLGYETAPMVQMSQAFTVEFEITYIHTDERIV